MKTICMFSIHRTGTNYLGSVLRQWPALAAYGELFHPDKVYGLKPVHLRAISNAAGREFDDASAPEFIAWARAHPLPMIEALRRVAKRKDKEGLYFKVFLGHWQAPLADVIAGLAREPGFVPIVLQRRCIDVYVSYRKAEAAGSYKHVDTTAVAVHLDAAAYARWAQQARQWYEGVTAALAQVGATPVHARYERDIDMPPAALAAHWATLLGVTPPSALDDALALPRQDRNERVEDKIANADEFFAGLKQRGLWEESQGCFLDAAR